MVRWLRKEQGGKSFAEKIGLSRADCPEPLAMQKQDGTEETEGSLCFLCFLLFR
jgi:hypothetical protein